MADENVAFPSQKYFFNYIKIKQLLKFVTIFQTIPVFTVQNVALVKNVFKM